MKVSLLPTWFGVLVGLAMPVAAAQRTYVAPTGVDNGACPLTTPCRTFAGALPATDPGGEIVVLGSAGYGHLTIDRSVTIAAPAGVHASIFASAGQNGIDIPASGGLTVTLRGLAITGQGGSIGIDYADSGKLNIEHCIIANMGSHGIRVLAPGRVTITDTVLRDNGGFGANFGGQGDYTLDSVRSHSNGAGGLQFAGTLRAAVARSAIDHGPVGIEIRTDGPLGDATVAIADTTITQTGQGGGLGGIRALANYTGTSVRVTVANTKVMESTFAAVSIEAVAGASASIAFGGGTISDAPVGVVAKGNGTTTATVSGSQIKAAIGLQQMDNAVLYSRGDNVISGTATPTAGVIMLVPGY